jgi:hypothetical protein
MNDESGMKEGLCGVYIGAQGLVSGVFVSDWRGLGWMEGAELAPYLADDGYTIGVYIVR